MYIYHKISSIGYLSTYTYLYLFERVTGSILFHRDDPQRLKYQSWIPGLRQQFEHPRLQVHRQTMRPLGISKFRCFKSQVIQVQSMIDICQMMQGQGCHSQLQLVQEFNSLGRMYGLTLDKLERELSIA